METVISPEDLAGCNPDSIFKLNVKFINEEDGSSTLQIEWDDKDPDLQWWTNLGEEKQQQFIHDSLTTACNNSFENNDN